jgi:PAT family beta-lactamase induction signal transducer AmpG
MNKFLKIITSKRMAIVLLLGFSSGIPLALTGSTLQAWMKSENVDLSLIGLFSLVGLPYTLKMVWAPLMDRFSFNLLGRRRGWILLAQIGLVIAIASMAFTKPAENPMVVAMIALIVAFFSASQDIVIDAYRADVLPESELGLGTSGYIMGYRLAMLTSGALALILSDQMSWQSVYLIMSGTLVIGILANLWAEEPETKVQTPKTLKDAIVLPLLEYFKRTGALEILAFIILYKLGDVIAAALTTPFIMSLGFTKTDIGTVTNGFGMIATIIGTLIGGALMVKFGVKVSLWVFGLLQAVSNLMFMFLARAGHDYSVMVSAITIENLCGGMSTAAYSAFMMTLCDKRFTATQYALLTSLMAVTRVIASAPSGFLAKAVGWEEYFLISTFLAIPGLLLLLRYDAWTRPQSK